MATDAQTTGTAQWVELIVTVPAASVTDVLELAEQRFPAGVRYEELEDGGLTLAVYLPPEHASDVARELAGVGAGDARTVPVPDDYADRWREFHQPVRIGRLWVGPPWCEPDAGSIPVVIDPGQGFGTGAHPTTQLCLSFLTDLRPKDLLDIGCGSGVLAIAAMLLGATSAHGVDNDPAAIESAVANVERSGQRIRIEEADALSGAPIPHHELLVANLQLDLLQRLAPRVPDTSTLVVSGLLRSQCDTAMDAFAARGFRLQERRDREGWSALLLAPPNDADSLRPVPGL